MAQRAEVLLGVLHLVLGWSVRNDGWVTNIRIFCDCLRKTQVTDRLFQPKLDRSARGPQIVAGAGINVPARRSCLSRQLRATVQAVMTSPIGRKLRFCLRGFARLTP